MSPDSESRILAQITGIGNKVESRIDRMDEKFDKKIDRLGDKVDAVKDGLASLDARVSVVETRSNGANGRIKKAEKRLSSISELTQKDAKHEVAVLSEGKRYWARWVLTGVGGLVIAVATALLTMHFK